VKRRFIKVQIAGHLLYVRPETDGKWLIFRMANSSGVLVDGRFVLVLADYLERPEVASHPFADYFEAALHAVGIQLPGSLAAPAGKVDNPAEGD
jgi:hypothetical protein